MNRFRAWGVAAALGVLAGATAPAVAADTPDDARPWYKKMFFSAPAGPKVGPVARSGPVAAAPNRAPTATLTPDAVAAAVKAEYVAWERRMSVCLKLREAAVERNDNELMRQVDELERQANAIYQQRVSALGVPKVKAPLPVAS